MNKDRSFERTFFTRIPHSRDTYPGIYPGCHNIKRFGVVDNPILSTHHHSSSFLVSNRFQVSKEETICANIGPGLYESTSTLVTNKYRFSKSPTSPPRGSSNRDSKPWRTTDNCCSPGSPGGRRSGSTVRSKFDISNDLNDLNHDIQIVRLLPNYS